MSHLPSSDFGHATSTCHVIAPREIGGVRLDGRMQDRCRVAGPLQGCRLPPAAHRFRIEREAGGGRPRDVGDGDVDLMHAQSEIRGRYQGDTEMQGRSRGDMKERIKETPGA